MFTRSDEHAPLEWSSLTRRLLFEAPDAGDVFKEIVDRLRPRAWSGSRATAIESRLILLNQLNIDTLPVLAEPMERARVALIASVEIERRRELAEAMQRDNRFE
ncbi:hypothetical protein [Methylobacterium sp. WL9]|uniref:hypothetical protein n=1 Tax=Methylobacterium sp. WL9 TaxID=2603898 RepID=UPI0011D3ACBB|nr:hypothetical protein [Methylobacterium sp. WL9]TXN21728.1 hypothetical protein FV217_13460 [Methylobacterium sp. WL9]